MDCLCVLSVQAVSEPTPLAGRFATRYGASMVLIDDDALDELEREFVSRVRGRVLEIGAGEGENFGAFHPDVEWIGLEPDAKRRAELATRAREWKHSAVPLDARAESIPLPDHSIDAVVGTYVLCSVGDVDATLAETNTGHRASFCVAANYYAASQYGCANRQIKDSPAPEALICCPARRHEKI